MIFLLRCRFSIKSSDLLWKNRTIVEVSPSTVTLFQSHRATASSARWRLFLCMSCHAPVLCLICLLVSMCVCLFVSHTGHAKTADMLFGGRFAWVEETTSGVHMDWQMWLNNPCSVSVLAGATITIANNYLGFNFLRHRSCIHNVRNLVDH